MIEVNTAGGFNAAERLTYFIPANTPTYTYNYNVDCNNDGIFEATNQAGSYTCNYPSVGVYTIAITGQYPHYYRPGFLDRKLIDVKQWGTQVWQSMRGMLQNVENITDFSATDQPDLSQVTDMSPTCHVCFPMPALLIKMFQIGMCRMSLIWSRCLTAH